MNVVKKVYSVIVFAYFIYFLGYAIFGLNTYQTADDPSDQTSQVDRAKHEFSANDLEAHLPEGSYVLGINKHITPSEIDYRWKRMMKENYYQDLASCDYTLSGPNDKAVTLDKPKNTTVVNNDYVLRTFTIEKDGTYTLTYPNQTMNKATCTQPLEVVPNEKNGIILRLIILAALILIGIPFARKRPTDTPE